MKFSLIMDALIYTAFFLGFFHTFIGPDHYIPFVALSKTRDWSYKKTMLITFICALGHIIPSVMIGVAGIAIGTSVGLLEGIEGQRADITKYLILAFGIAYLIYGLKTAYKNTNTHSHFHTHGTESHSHEHNHSVGHLHEHKNEVANATNFWVIFLIFVFGPCEILIPLLMYPAMEFNYMAILFVTLAFSVSTIFTMLSMVTLFYFGLDLISLKTKFFSRWANAISGLAIMACAGLMFLGL